MQRVEIEIAAITKVVAERGFAFAQTRTGRDVFVHATHRWHLSSDSDGLVVTTGRNMDWPVAIGEKLVLFGVEQTAKGVGCKAWGSAVEYSQWELYDTPQHRAVLLNGETVEFPNLGKLVEQFPRAPDGARDSVARVMCRSRILCQERRENIRFEQGRQVDRYINRHWNDADEDVVEELMSKAELDAQREIDRLEWEEVSDPRPPAPALDESNPFVKALLAKTKKR